ncbi:MAG: ABC transporter ATP-binding protein [Actinobacteria bacterium]|nr:ABC transporter ATP-binding protein [Actinomycetota bacterium]
MTTAPLRCRDLVVTFPDGPTRRTILDHLDLDVEAGEIVTISGESGSGKSTLLTVAGLLRRADSGEVTVAGHDAADLSERRRTALRRDHIAFVYQSANLLPSLTAVEQLQLVGHIRGERPSSTRARALALLDDLGLADRANQLPTELSGGERQRVGVARALIAEPAVLIADEPTASLDPARADSVAELLASAAHDRGIATLVVAHDDATRRRADRHLRLVDGRLRDESAAAGAADVGR